jgi:hypothetical protein
MRRGGCLDWTEILRRGGVPEPPGREEALQPVVRQWRARLRKRKGSQEIEEKIEARAYHVALAECRQRFKDYSIILLREWTQS